MMQRARGTDRILDIIEWIAGENNAVGRGQIAAGMGIPRSTVYALCEVLLHREWLKEDSAGLWLGPKAGFVSNAYLRERGFESMARDVLAELAAATGALAELDTVEDWLHVVAISEGRMALGYISPIEGARLPLMPTAAARVMLADVADDRILKSVRDDELVDVSGAPVSLEHFFEARKLCRDQGYTEVTGWFDGTVSTLACPVRDNRDRTLASICLIIATSDLNRRRDFYVDRLKAGALSLGEILNRVPWGYAERCWHQLHSEFPRGIPAFKISDY